MDDASADQRANNETADADYDYAIIGMGIGGLALDALLANAGHRVIIFEQHYVPGGYGHTYRSDRFFFAPNSITFGIAARANESTVCRRSWARKNQSRFTNLRRKVSIELLVRASTTQLAADSRANMSDSVSDCLLIRKSSRRTFKSWTRSAVRSTICLLYSHGNPNSAP